MRRFAATVLAYLVPTFALGFVWHLVLFERYYEALRIYRTDIIIPFGFLSMLVQGLLFARVYEALFARQNRSWLFRGLLYGVFGAALSWSFTTLAVAAKNLMVSVSGYVLIETAFTVAQWIVVGPLTALVFERIRGPEVHTSKPAI
jgi:hypothetical protein